MKISCFSESRKKSLSDSSVRIREVQIQIKFGIVCKYYREQAKISQEKFALQIGMDRTYYASVEAGKRNISLQNISKIADGFGIQISELFKKIESL